MKNKLFLSVILVIFLIIPFYVSALSPEEIKNRVSECSKLELADAKEDGSLAKVECYENYNDAKRIMNETENDNLVIIENGMIIDAKYGLVDYNFAYPSGSNKYTDVYISSTSNTTNGAYISSREPDDAALIDYDYNTKRVKIKVAGLVGWINKYEQTSKLYEIVPIVWVKTPQYYKVTNDDLIHVFPNNMYGNQGSSISIDIKPDMLDVGNYYSYDGHYFYTSLKTLLQDYKNGNYNQAVNKDKPYYNYYQYLSFRTLTNHDSDNIDLYFTRRLAKDSKMLSTGKYFVETQNRYGVNAILMLAIGMNESNGGTSDLARNKNNLFGLNAIDKSPGESANYFPSVRDCIDTYGYVWMSYWYLQPGDFHFKGANLGNKSEGLNYKYASDPFWSEKAAHYYYDIDRMFGFLDRNSYQLAVLNNNYDGSVYAKKTPGGENVSSSYYQYTIKDSAVVVLDEVEGPSVNGNTKWYKIQSDPVLDKNLEYIGDSKSNPRIMYDWGNSYVYVSAYYFTKINTGTGNIPPIPKQEAYVPTTPTSNTNIKEISSLVTGANYKYKDSTIFGISPNTSIDTVKKNFTNIGGSITITDINGNMKTTGNIGTGDIISVSLTQTEKLSVLIYGDTDGDGEISAVDYVRIKNSIMGSLNLDGIYKSASDVNKDGVVDAVDYVNIKNYIMGSSNVISN